MNETREEKFSIEKIGKSVSSAAPKVSIIIPAYNVAEYIAETLDSVLAQTFKDYEIILVNDGSPDTEEFERVLEPYFEHIIYICQENIGAGAARDVAIEKSRGGLLAFLDGDDVWLSEYLKSQVDFLEKNNYDLVYSDALLFGGSVYDGQHYSQTSPSEGEANFESLLDLRCNVITSGAVARKQAVIDAGMFEQEKVRAHDFVLWLKMAHQGSRVGYQKRVLLKYRVRLDSLSGDSIQRLEREIEVFKRVSKMFPLDEPQKEIVRHHTARISADLEVERGKSFLLEENFDAARAAFEKANRYRRSNRLRVIIGLINIAPRVLLKIYQSRRAGEIDFVPKIKKEVENKS